MHLHPTTGTRLRRQHPPSPWMLNPSLRLATIHTGRFLPTQALLYTCLFEKTFSPCWFYVYKHTSFAGTIAEPSSLIDRLHQTLVFSFYLRYVNSTLFELHKGGGGFQNPSVIIWHHKPTWYGGVKFKRGETPLSFEGFLRRWGTELRRSLRRYLLHSISEIPACY